MESIHNGPTQNASSVLQDTCASSTTDKRNSSGVQWVSTRKKAEQSVCQRHQDICRQVLLKNQCLVSTDTLRQQQTQHTATCVPEDINASRKTRNLKFVQKELTLDKEPSSEPSVLTTCFVQKARAIQESVQSTTRTVGVIATYLKLKLILEEEIS